MSDPDLPALFRSMQEQLGMLQAEFIQLKDISVSKLLVVGAHRPVSEFKFSRADRSSGGP